MVSLVILSSIAAGCGGMPGVTGVGMRADAPDRSWTEARFLDVYGEPSWRHTLRDGRRVMYFDYNSAFDDTTMKAVSAAAFIMTFGIDRQLDRATSRRLAAVFNADGSAVCADRQPYNVAMECDNEVRHAALSGLEGERRQEYWYLVVDIDRREFALDTYIVSTFHEAPLGDPLAELSASEIEPPETMAYYRDLFCYAAGRWYARHLDEFRLHEQQAPSRARLEQLEVRAYQQMTARGAIVPHLDRDMGLVYQALQIDLDVGNLRRPRRLAQSCLFQPYDRAMTEEIYDRVDAALYSRIRAGKNLAQAMVVRDFEVPASTPARFELRSHPVINGSIGKSADNWLTSDKLSELSFNSDPWRKVVAAEIDALQGEINTFDRGLDAALLERQILAAYEQGAEPSAGVAHSLVSLLYDAVGRGDHVATAETLTTLGRFYMTGSPLAIRYARAGDLFMSAAYISHYLQRFDRAAGLSNYASEAYLLAADAKLAEYGAGTRRERDQLRDIVSFVPYEYETKDADGTTWRTRVEAKPIDAERMLKLIDELKVYYANANTALRYALPLQTDAATAATYFELLGERANETFSSYGAWGFYSSAADTYRTVDESAAIIPRLHAAFANVRMNSSGAGKWKDISCANVYAPARRAYAEHFGNPDKRQIRKLHGDWLGDRIVEYDRKCELKKLAV
jgi:hypothetical protein